MRQWPYTKNAPMAQKFCDQGRKTTFATLSAIVAGQTCRPEGAGVMAVNVRFGPKADISACRCNVRFTPKSGQDTSALCQKRTLPWAEEACGLRDELNRVTIARSAQWGPDNPCRLGFLSAPRARKGCFWSAGVEYWFSTQPSTGKRVGE